MKQTDLTFLSPKLALTSSPYPQEIAYKKPWHDFIKHNGYLSHTKRLNVSIVSDASTASTLWNIFSSNKGLWDLWDVRKSFFEGTGYEPYFIVLHRGIKNINNVTAILPLWWSKEFKKYNWFGGNYPENNIFFVADHDYIPLLLLAAPSPLRLGCIDPKEHYSFMRDFTGFRYSEEKKYVIDITLFRDFNDFLHGLKKKKRHNIKRDRKHILSLKPKIVYDRYEDIDTLFSLNIKRFSFLYSNGLSKDKSEFEDLSWQHCFRRLIANQGVYKVRMISTEINGTVESVELGCLYKKTYTSLISGTNVQAYPGLGTFSNSLIVEDAIRLESDTIDLLEEESNWKHDWANVSYFQYLFVK